MCSAHTTLQCSIKPVRVTISAVCRGVITACGLLCVGASCFSDVRQNVPVHQSCTDHGEDKSNNGARDLELVCALHVRNPFTGQEDLPPCSVFLAKGLSEPL